MTSPDPRGCIDPATEAALRKAGVVWVDLGEGTRVVWHLWHEGAVWLVCGGLEQELPSAEAVATTAPEGATSARRASVVVRGPDDAVLRFTADVSRILPTSAEWASVVPLLHEKRLNPPDGEEQPDRWAQESFVLRLTPSG